VSCAVSDHQDDAPLAGRAAGVLQNWLRSRHRCRSSMSSAVRPAGFSNLPLLVAAGTGFIQCRLQGGVQNARWWQQVTYVAMSRRGAPCRADKDVRVPPGTERWVRKGQVGKGKWGKICGAATEIAARAGVGTRITKPPMMPAPACLSASHGTEIMFCWQRV